MGLAKMNYLFFIFLVALLFTILSAGCAHQTGFASLLPDSFTASRSAPLVNCSDLPSAPAGEAEGSILGLPHRCEIVSASRDGGAKSGFQTAQNGGRDDTFRLDEITVTATRTVRHGFDTPRAVTIVDRDEIEKESQPSIIDSLDDKAGIWVEKRTMTTGDPVMRGLSGGNILALVDGCTLTTLWGEGGYAGDDMYGKIDSESIERIEVIRGPSSVLYGSNALGGAINFITRSCPYDFTTAGARWGGRTKAGYASASDYFLARQEIYCATPSVRIILGGTSHKFGDTEGGRGVGTMSPTGGRDYSWDFKGEYRLDANQELEIAVQDMKRHKVRRYYRADQQNFNDREAVTITWRGDNVSRFINSLEVNGYTQDKLDMRKDFAGADPVEDRAVGRAQTRTYSGDIQAISLLGESHRLTYGLHYHEDHGVCPDDEQFMWTKLDTGFTVKVAPDSVWNNLGMYVQDEWDLSSRWTVISSLRYDRFRFHSDVDQYYIKYPRLPAGYDPMNDQFADNHGVLSGGIGLVHRLTGEVNLVGNLTRGFRLFPPKFGLTHHGAAWRAPHEFLDPIVNHTAEVGVKTMSERFASSCFAYYSSIRNWQSWGAGTWNGMAFLDGNGNGLQEPGEDDIFVIKEGRANVYGVELETETRLDLLSSDIPEEWVLAAGFAWNLGNDYRKGEDKEPLRHTQPARALLSLRWKDSDKERNGWFEINADMVRRYDRIPSDRWRGDRGYLADPQNPASGKIRDGGYLPGYTVYDVRGGIDLADDLSLTVAVENLTDKKYRRAHSRWNEPGTNLLATVTYRF